MPLQDNPDTSAQTESTSSLEDPNKSFRSHVEIGFMIFENDFTESEIDEATLEAKSDEEIRNRLKAILDRKSKQGQ